MTCVYKSKILLAWIAVFSTVNVVRAQSFVFETSTARLVIRSDGTASSLIAKQSGKEQLNPPGQPLAVVSKYGHPFAATKVEQSGYLYHVTFGNSGVLADYRITSSPDYIVVELTAIQGDGVDKITMVRLSVPLANSGGTILGVRWNEEFSICLMGLSEEVDTGIAGPILSASVYPTYGMKGKRVAIIAVPTSQFLNTVQKVERDFQLPSATIGGVWAKLSRDVRTSYLFTDLTESNADETIRYAKMGGLGYILVYASTWASSLGSYPINLTSFPNGEAGLKAVIDRCHAAGLKVGMHMLTSFVGKSDPLVRPKPDPGLLKDDQGTLSTDLSAQATELAVTSTPTGVLAQAGSSDLVIDDEIIHCNQINGLKVLQCIRGFAGTKAGVHKGGAKIQHLTERDGAYLADLRSPLAGVIADRVAGVINRAGFDMIYFDGGELNSANGPSWYWVGVQQSQIFTRARRDLLVQGSGITDWTWHFYSRGTCDDFSAVAPKQYLDYHKIPIWQMDHNSFMPAELGWVGFLQDSPDHPATTPDELEYYAVRMLALDSAVSLEATLSSLKANGRSEEMLKLLAEYEQLRLSGAVPKLVRQQLAQGEWHMTGRGEFHPIRYDMQRMTIPGEITVNNTFHLQPLNFRLQVVPELAASHDPANILLLRSLTAVKVRDPDSQDAMPGTLAERFDLSKALQNQGTVFMVGPNDRTPSRALNLTTHRALAVQLEVEGPVPASGEIPVLNIQLEAGGPTYRDYYIDLDFRGTRTVILPEPKTSRMLTEFPPAYSSYPLKAAMYSFNYANVIALNLRWMRFSKGSGVQCRIGSVEALAERSSVLKDFEISLGAVKISIPGEMKTGDYAEYWDPGPVHVFDRNGVLLRTVPATHAPVMRVGGNRLTVTASEPGSVKLTAITLGN